MNTYAKALVAALTAAVASVAPVVDDGLTAGEALFALGAALTAGAAVWTVPNRPRKAE